MGVRSYRGGGWFGDRRDYCHCCRRIRCGLRRGTEPPPHKDISGAGDADGPPECVAGSRGIFAAWAFLGLSAALRPGGLALTAGAILCCQLECLQKMNAGISSAILLFMGRGETVRWVFVIGLLCDVGCSSGEEGTDNDEDAVTSGGGNADNGAMGGTLLGAGGTQVAAGGQGAVGGSQQSAGGVQDGAGGAGSGGLLDAAGGAESSGGADGSGGAESSGGADGSGGEASACPSSPPILDTDCSGSLVGCFYEDCAGEGRTLAYCLSGSWFIESAACGV